MRTERQLRGHGVASQFYRMPPRPCPYIPGNIEQNVFTELAGAAARGHYDSLSSAGFRRSHAIAYRPACPGCASCVPVRAVAKEFAFSRSQRRIWKQNSDLSGVDRPAQATREQFKVFARYLQSRHGEGEMASMEFEDYRSMLEDTPLDTVLTEFRDGAGNLVGGCLVDRIEDGLSAVYSFFEPSEERRGLGTYVVLWLIEHARALDLDYVYLGYWIEASPKMSYKTRFRPLEALGPDGWQLLEP